jgi:hypothetical protein
MVRRARALGSDLDFLGRKNRDLTPLPRGQAATRRRVAAFKDIRSADSNDWGQISIFLVGKIEI